MSDTSTSPATSARKAVIDPVPRKTVNLIGIGYLLLACLFFYLLITAWPVQDCGGTTRTCAADALRPVNIFGWSHRWTPDRQLLFMVVMAGALGSLIHTMTSFGDYVGNRELSLNWLWFLALRIPVGVAVAVLFYFIVRGGILIPTVQGNPSTGFTPEDTLKINPYAIAGFAALAGMFSKQATDKLAAVFDAIYAMKDPVDRRNALGSSKPIMIVPAELFQGEVKKLSVTGSGFEDKTTATVNGHERKFTATSATVGTVDILNEDVKDVGKLQLVITNPNRDVFSAEIPVLAKPPVISSTDPPELTAAGSKSLTINGQGFQAGATVTVNGRDRKPSSRDDKKIVITLEDADVVTPGDLKLAVKNPDGALAERTIKVLAS